MKTNVFNWHKQFREGHENVKDYERSVRPRSLRTDENVERVRTLVHSDRRFKYQSYGYATKWRQTVKKGLNFGPTIGFIVMTVLQLTRSFWLKNRLLKWNTHPIPPFWLRMTSGSFQNKVCLKGTKGSGYWRHPKMWRWHWKLFDIRSPKNVSISGSIVGLSA
jgi:hypothetical protein